MKSYSSDCISHMTLGDQLLEDARLLFFFIILKKLPALYPRV